MPLSSASIRADVPALLRNGPHACIFGYFHSPRYLAFDGSDLTLGQLLLLGMSGCRDCQAPASRYGLSLMYSFSWEYSLPKFIHMGTSKNPDFVCGGK
jgi:hypothetical protein